jgi:hypothetical protein
MPVWRVLPVRTGRRIVPHCLLAHDVDVGGVLARRALDYGIASNKLRQWLCLIGTGLHKGLFVPMLDKTAPPEMKAHVLGKGFSRLDHLENYLKGREFRLDHLSLADGYLATVINWTMATPR